MKNSDYGPYEVAEALRAAGVGSGDVVFSHASVGLLGMPSCGCSAQAVYEMWRNAFFSVAGEEGTWVLPAFSYSFCRGEEFDPLRTPGQCGVLSEEARRDKHAVRSEDANFSVVAIGARADELTRNPPPKSFGDDCFFARFLSMGGKFVNLNVHPATTFIHYVEAANAVPYRWHKPFPGRVLVHGKAEERTYWHFVYDLGVPDHAPDFARFNNEAYRTGAAKDVQIGRGRLTCISAEDTQAIVDDNLSKDISFLLRGRFHG